MKQAHERKTVVVTFRITEADARALQRKAAELQVKPADLFRLGVLEVQRQQGQAQRPLQAA